MRSARATQMSIKIIEVFVEMRKMLLSHKDILLELEVISKRVGIQDENIEMIFNYLKQFEESKKTERESIGYNIKKNT